MHLTRLLRTGAQWSANIRGGLKTDSKCLNTSPPEADSTFESRFSPCFVEHLNVLKSDVKSRIPAGSLICYY